MRLGWSTHHERKLVLDGLVPVDYVRHCSKEPLCGTWLVVQGHLGTNSAEAAVFRNLELNRKLVGHKVFFWKVFFWKVLWPLESRGNRFIAADTSGLQKGLFSASHPERGKSAARKRAQVTVKRHLVNVDATF